MLSALGSAAALMEQPLTAEEAHARAAAEGLTLVPGPNATGFRGVQECQGKFKAHFHWQGTAIYGGTFDSVAEAAIAVATIMGPEGSARAAAEAAEAAASADWGCDACTFLNPPGQQSCEMCGTCRGGSLQARGQEPPAHAERGGASGAQRPGKRDRGHSDHEGVPPPRQLTLRHFLV
mmetsp:Transcript_11021/g.35048  ORF Transcript_11021/g.35048 Transcript_11021/m.35048 type:complete len:178 (-) Transcript_11021:181-714(-)